MDAHDFLDKIGLSCHVASPGRRRDSHGRTVLDAESQTFQYRYRLRLGYLQSPQARDIVGIKVDHAAPIWNRSRNDSLGRFAAAPLQDQLGREFEPRNHELRIDTALKAVARIGENAEFLSRACSARRIEIGGLDEDVRRR